MLLQRERDLHTRAKKEFLALMEPLNKDALAAECVKQMAEIHENRGKDIKRKKVEEATKPKQR